MDNPPAEKAPARPPRQTPVVEKEEPAAKIVLEPEILQIVWSPDGPVMVMFTPAWLADHELRWAADLIPDLTNLETSS